MMASYINIFLKTEITVIPRLLDKYIGKYYNNTLCNGAAWMFLSWYLLHVVFDDLLNALLRRMKYKEYLRIRLKRSLWYLGFYSTACVYCAATLFRNNIPFYNAKKPFDSTSTPSGHLILGFIVLATFYLHSAFWEKLKYSHVILASSYMCLFLMLCFSYFLRFVEGTFRLTILICFTQIALEMARCVAILIKKTENSRTVAGTFFTISVFSFIINYLLISLPLLGYPLLKEFSPSVSILLSLLLTWLTLEICGSVLFKAVLHWVSHKDKLRCDKDIFECSLFPPRNDATYNFLILRREIKEREEKCMSLRRPKNRNMVMQTLKCMVAIKRKLNEKRQCSNMNKEVEHPAQETETRNITDDKKKVDSDAGATGITGALQFSIVQGSNESDNHANDTNKCKKD